MVVTTRASKEVDTMKESSTFCVTRVNDEEEKNSPITINPNDSKKYSPTEESFTTIEQQTDDSGDDMITIDEIEQPKEEEKSFQQTKVQKCETLSTTTAKSQSSSRLFQPYRTVGIITSGQGFQVQPAGTENFLVVPIGDRFQVLRVSSASLKPIFL